MEAKFDYIPLQTFKILVPNIKNKRDNCHDLIIFSMGLYTKAVKRS